MQGAFGGAMAAGLSAFGDHFEQRIANVEHIADTALDIAQRSARDVREVQTVLDASQAVLSQRIAKPEQQSKHIEELNAKFEKVKVSANSGGTRSSGFGSIPSSTLHSTPYHLRTSARIRNLGWDTTAEQLLTHAKNVLEKARVDKSLHGPVVPAVGRNGKGSACELTFKNAADLQVARRAVCDLKEELVEGKTVWLDAKREPAEIRASRVIHRIAEMLSEMKSARPAALEVEKKFKGKNVSVGGHRAVYTLSGNVKWTQ